MTLPLMDLSEGKRPINAMLQACHQSHANNRIFGNPSHTFENSKCMFYNNTCTAMELVECRVAPTDDFTLTVCDLGIIEGADELGDGRITWHGQSWFGTIKLEFCPETAARKLNTHLYLPGGTHRLQTSSSSASKFLILSKWTHHSVSRPNLPRS